MLGSCRCNKSTFAQLSLNEARIWRSFQSQWSKRSSSTQLSWTTFHHDQEGMMAVSWYKVLQHFQMIGTSWNHLNKTWTQPVHSMNPCKDTLKLCAAVLQTWSKKARISPSTNIFNNKLVENTSDFNFMMMSVILVFFQWFLDLDAFVESQMPSQKLNVVLHVITDGLLSALLNFRKDYEKMNGVFAFPHHLPSLTSMHIVVRALSLFTSYQKMIWKKAFVTNLCSFLSFWNWVRCRYFHQTRAVDVPTDNGKVFGVLFPNV